MKLPFRRIAGTLAVTAAVLGAPWLGSRLALRMACSQASPSGKLKLLSIASALGSTEASAMRAIEYFDAGKYAEAKVGFDKGIKRLPSYPVFYLYRAEIYKSQGNLRAALGDYDKAYILMGPFLREQVAKSGDIARAAADRGATLAAVSRGLHSRLLRGRCAVYASLGRFGDALVDVETAARISPADWRIHAARAAAYSLIFQEKRAVDDIKLAYKLGADKAGLEEEIASFPAPALKKLSREIRKNEIRPTPPPRGRTP
ncbi:MAG: hypothetical protein PHP45_10795 [Elusimicrobiales bacterium]|nr:hypothetical protein [Elusimicrobiales bacterium]